MRASSNAPRHRRGTATRIDAVCAQSTPSTTTGVPSGSTPLAAEKLSRLLTNDPGMGVVRHVDAGYDRAAEVAAERGVRIPMTE